MEAQSDEGSQTDLLAPSPSENREGRLLLAEPEVFRAVLRDFPEAAWLLTMLRVDTECWVAACLVV